MKRQSFIYFLGLGMLLLTGAFWSSCTKLGQNLRFSLPMQTGSVNITIPPSNTTGTAITFGPSSNYYNVDSFIKASTANQFGIANISSVKMKSCIITIGNATSDNNFANFQSCTASFYSNTNSNPYTLTIPNNPDAFSNTLTLPVDTTAELSSYLGDQFFYNVTAILRRATTQSLNCTISYSFNVVVKG